MLRTRPQNRRSMSRRALAFDNLESRQVLSISSLWFSGATLVVKTDDAATSVDVSQVGSNIEIQEVGSGRAWSYAPSSVGTVEFQGGAGNDRFVDYISNLPIRAFGFGGNDYLEGYNASDYFDGGDSDDTLVGYGGDDLMFGGPGNDVLLGLGGNDTLEGAGGDDTLYGGAGADLLNGGEGLNTYDAGATDGRRVLYINFDGANITYANLVDWGGSDWNADASGGLDANRDGIQVQPYLDGQANREQIIDSVLVNLLQDFAPFDVDIQRHDGLAVPGQRATTLFVGPAVIDGALPGLRGQASDVDFGNDNQTDVAFVVATWSSPNPVEVAQFTANTAAHEVGHTYGLAHVDNAGANELMRVGALATNTQNATINYGFLDSDFDRAEADWDGTLSYILDSSGRRVTQNSFRTLERNLGLV